MCRISNFAKIDFSRDNNAHGLPDGEIKKFPVDFPILFRHREDLSETFPSISDTDHLGWSMIYGMDTSSSQKMTLEKACNVSRQGF